MSESMEPPFLVLETSTRTGYVAVGQGSTLLGVRRLDEARHHARDLTPAAAELLSQHGWMPRDINAVIVSRGPGSYTGLRVGMISAKTLAYVTGCALLAVDTFAVIARQAPEDARRLDVIADAQQERIYAQEFARDLGDAGWRAMGKLAIWPLSDWLERRTATNLVTGPGLHVHAKRLAGAVPLTSSDHWDPQPESLLHLGWMRFQAGERDDVWATEPLYLRPSAAEQQWQERAGSV